MVRTWTEVGRPAYGYVGTDLGEHPTITEAEGRRRIKAAIRGLEWVEPVGTFPMSPGLGIKAAIEQLQLPKVSAVAISSDLAPFGLLGIEANYRNGRARVYIVDRGSDMLPVASDFEAKS